VLGSVVLISALWNVTLADGNGTDWQDSIPSAINDAAETGKPVVVDVWAVWCAPCKLMEEKTWNLPTVIEAMNSFVALKVDSDANEVFTLRYDAEVLPATLFLDGEGRLITRLTGFVGDETLLQTMTAVREGYDAYLAAQPYKNDPAVMEQLSDYFRSAGNPGEAVDLLKRSIRKDRQASADLLESRQIKLAEALILADRPERAAKSMSRLAERATVPENRGRALEALVKAERASGRDTQAAEALERLRTRFPERAAALE